MKNTATVKVINNEIIASKTFLNKAQNFGTREYEILKQVRQDYPNAQIKVKKIKKNPEKESYKNLTYRNMEIYFKSLEGNEKATALAEYEIAKTRSKIQRSPYKFMVKWFTARFPEYKESTVFMDDDAALAAVRNTAAAVNTSMMAG